MNIRKMLDPVAQKVCDTINATNGWNIGTSLQNHLEERVNAILPAEIDYEFQFNMSGSVRHVFYEKSNPANFIEV